MQIDPRRLETFRVVALAGKVSAAARLLHLSQPAVTAQLRQLEEEVGELLLVRGLRGVTLNAAGQRLFEYAQQMRQLLDRAQESLREPSEPGGELVLAASTTVASYLLPRLIASFLRTRPGTGVRLEVGNTAQVIEWVGRSAVPLGLVEGHGRAAGMRLEAFVRDELLPVVAGNPSPTLLRVRRPQDFQLVPIVWREPGSGTRAVVERALRRAGARRGSRAGDLQLAGTESIKEAVALGLGVGFLSRWSIQAELRLGRLRILPVRGLTIERQFSWALPVNEPSGLAGRFLHEARLEPPVLGG